MRQEDCVKMSDNDLVRLSIDNSDYYSCLITRYEPKLLRYVTRLSKLDRDDAEDILQEVFIKTYYHLNDFKPELQFSSWIYRIAHNETISQIRKRSIRPTVSLDGEDLKIVEDVFSIEQEIDNSFDKEKVLKVISLLDEKYKEVLTLRYLEDKNYIEISDILKKPVSTVGNLIARGKNKFRAEYRKLLFDKDVF